MGPSGGVGNATTRLTLSPTWRDAVERERLYYLASVYNFDAQQSKQSCAGHRVKPHQLFIIVTIENDIFTYQPIKVPTYFHIKPVFIEFGDRGKHQ